MYLYLLLSLIIVWLIIVSALLFKTHTLFNKLSKGVEEDLTKKGFGEVRRRLDTLETEGKSHIQKVGLVRFNPFKELGGDHSFVLAILNGTNDGVIITSLHTRDRTRVYMKDVKNGKGLVDLSQEEEKALKNAIK